MIQELLRLALLIYLAPMQRRFRIRMVTAEAQLVKLLRQLQRFDKSHVSMDRNLQLWAVTVALLEAVEGPMRDSYLNILCGMLAYLNISSMEEMENRLQEVMWVQQMHGEQFRALWNTELRFLPSTGYLWQERL